MNERAAPARNIKTGAAFFGHRACGTRPWAAALFCLAGQLFSKKVETVQERTSFVGYWSNEKGERIDQVVVLCYPAAHSLTGEDAAFTPGAAALIVLPDEVSEGAAALISFIDGPAV